MSQDEHAGLVTMRLVHRATLRDLRRVGTRARQRAASPDPSATAAWVEYSQRLLQVLEHHHQGEDEMLWPALAERGADGAALRQLTSEHHDIETLLQDLGEVLAGTGAQPTDSARLTQTAELAEQLTEVLANHCQHEEELLAGVLAPSLDKTLWDRFAKHMLQTAPRWTLTFMPPWMDSVAEAEERSKVPARPIAFLFRGRLRRQQQRAFADSL